MTIFPDDENGRVLRNIAARGNDLTKPRDIDIVVVFAQASSAEQFAEHFRGLGYAVSVQETESGRDYPWDAIVVRHMVPTYEGITDFRERTAIGCRPMGRPQRWMGLLLRADSKLTLKNRATWAIPARSPKRRRRDTA